VPVLKCSHGQIAPNVVFLYFDPPGEVKLNEGWGTKLTRVLSRVFRTVANGDFNVCCLMLPCSRLVSVFIENKTISMTRSVKIKNLQSYGLAALEWFLAKKVIRTLQDF
jgi:hypothetical protein